MNADAFDRLTMHAGVGCSRRDLVKLWRRGPALLRQYQAHVQRRQLPDLSRRSSVLRAPAWLHPGGRSSASRERRSAR